MFDLFQPNLPLHLLKGAEAGIDIHMFIDAVWRRFTQKPKLITPEDLRLVPDSQCKTGYQLCCVSKQKGDINDNSVPSTLFNHKGEKLEKIHQVGLELHQQELAALEPELLRHLSLCCFNDMRTILLVHDKRMLGIIRQEIPKMLTRKLLDKDQASILESGIVETILPGSQEMQALLQASEHSLRLQNDYILKPIRGGKGIGIVFGEDLDCDEWLAELRRLQSPGSGLSSGCVAQRRIIPCEYDLMLKPSGVMEKYPLVGTYHVTNGRLLGLGTWRASSGRIVAVSSGGSWICSVMHR